MEMVLMGEKSILSFNKAEQYTYVENLLLTQETEVVLTKLLLNENKNLEITKLIKEVTNKKKIKSHLKTINSIRTNKEFKKIINSLIIKSLSYNNKTEELNIFIKNLEPAAKEELYNYDKVKDIITNHFKTLKANNKKNKIIIALIIILLILLGISIYFGFKDIELVSSYDNKIYPNFYINDIDISGKTYDELKSSVEAMKTEILNRSVIFEYNENTKTYKMSSLGLSIDTSKLLEELSHYTDNLNFKDKLILAKSNKEKKYYLESNYNEGKIIEVINELKKDFNKKKRNAKLTVDNNHEVKFINKIDGFTLDENKLKNDIINLLKHSSLKENEFKITLTGSLDKAEDKTNNLSQINKKISTFTTTFANYGPRGHNVSLASQKLNGTILQPGEVFSFRKVVGPYSLANGYRIAPIQQNGEEAYASGGGVCQMATTMFNAQLLAGLETVYRTNHGAPVAYVGRGLDATVYGDSTDYKFKNNYKYPVYIVSYTTSNTLTVDVWSNEKSLDGKTFKPTVVAKNALEYLTYLNVYKDGKKIETKYVSYSYYLK